ncbi:hypothetical protein [Dyadobacter sandarakinus]|uniref:Succinogenes major domain (Fib_succ_major) n=1 Tax=Dyadobacter sandarakinus TaxID=2747268 RepID=A0ABX7ICI5_9BACT|nr:hypothetical protein [Dyadobacter sandarakinus]QRR03433.1 hypothetical protein HWI92_22220 [Dyadobacter sandarakinus]
MMTHFLGISSVFPTRFVQACIILAVLSCQKDVLAPETGLISQAVGKIETEYVAGQEKIEVGGNEEVETFATAEVINEVRTRLQAYQKNFETRYKVTRNLSEGYPVGVIPAVDACPAGTEKVKFFMDNQDGGSSSRSGWTGAWTVDQNGNSWHTLCVVYGGVFRFMILNKPTEYLLVRFGNNKSLYMEPRVWNVYMDNEDKNNKNALAEGDLSPSFINSKGTNLQFWAISGNTTPGPNQDAQFPDLGFSYGVFGTFSAPVIAGGSGTLKTDDENNNNANQLYSVDWNTNAVTNASYVQGFGVDRTNDPGNTTFNIRRVR